MPDPNAEIQITLTRAQIEILHGITAPRAASLDAAKYDDWSVDLDRRLAEALEQSETR